MIEREADPSTGADDQVIPAAASDSWRAWLMTGIRRGPVARRRVRGAHKGIKKILVEGTTNGGEGAHPWKDFSGVMVRQAVDAAVNTLPAQQKQVVKLAYFAGLSNREISDRLGLSVAGVEKRLRQGLATVSEYVERGRAGGRRAVLGLTMFLPGRLLGGLARRASGPGTDHLMQAGVLVGAGAAAAAVLALQTGSPAHLNQVERGVAAPFQAVQSHVVAQPGATLPVKVRTTTAGASVSPVVLAGATILHAPAALPSLPIPITIPPHKLNLPPLPSLGLPPVLPPGLPPLPPLPLPHLH
jgi:hypothetical protein